MPLFQTTDEVLNNLNENDRHLVTRLNEKLLVDSIFFKQACEFVKNKIGEHTDDLDEFSDETKRQACLEYIAIGLIAGNIEREDLEKLLK